MSVKGKDNLFTNRAACFICSVLLKQFAGVDRLLLHIDSSLL